MQRGVVLVPLHHEHRSPAQLYDIHLTAPAPCQLQPGSAQAAAHLDSGACHRRTGTPVAAGVLVAGCAAAPGIVAAAGVHAAADSPSLLGGVLSTPCHVACSW